MSRLDAKITVWAISRMHAHFRSRGGYSNLRGCMERTGEMKAELTLPQELVSEIVDRLFEKLKPLLLGNGKQEEDVIMDKKGLAKYLNVSESTINKLVSNKQIPYFKIHQGQSGGVRFFKRNIDKWISRHTIPEINYYTGKLIKAVS